MIGSKENMITAAFLFVCGTVADVNAFSLPLTSRLRGKFNRMPIIFTDGRNRPIQSSLFSTQEEVMAELANFEPMEPQVTVQNEDDWRRLRRSIIARQR